LYYQLDIRHKPCNFIELIPRLNENNIIGVDEVGRGSLVGSAIICAFKSSDDIFKIFLMSYGTLKNYQKKERVNL